MCTKAFVVYNEEEEDLPRGWVPFCETGSLVPLPSTTLNAGAIFRSACCEARLDTAGMAMADVDLLMVWPVMRLTFRTTTSQWLKPLTPDLGCGARGVLPQTA